MVDRVRGRGDVEAAEPAQRIGMVLSLLEGLLFGLAAALHFGLALHLGGTTLAAPFLYPAGIVEGVLALALLISVILPGPGTVRAGRVLGAQVLAILGMFIVQVAFLRGPELMSWRNELLYGVALVLSLATLALIASPATRRRSVVP